MCVALLRANRFPPATQACVLEGSDYTTYLDYHPTWRLMERVPCSSYGDIIDKLDRGECLGTVLPKPAAQLLTEGDYFCDSPLSDLELVITDVLPGVRHSALGFGMSHEMDPAVMARLDYWISRRCIHF